MYINDRDRLAQSMGQFQMWAGKLIYYHSDQLGWRYIK